MITAPPPINTVQQTPLALSILCGLAGVSVAVGAGVSGFIQQLASRGQSTFYWGATPQVVAGLALAGAVLALMRHEAGPPLVAGSGVVFAVVVAVTLTSDRLRVSDFVDAYDWRGLAFIVGGLAAGLASILGLVSLRGRGKPAFGVVTLVVGGGLLACHAAYFRLDDRQVAFNVWPMIGIAVAMAVMVLGSFIGRAGALIAAAGALCLFPVYADAAEFPGSDRRTFVILAAIGLAVILVVSVVAAVSASRQPVVQYFASPAGGWSGYPVEPTQILPVQGGDTSPYGTPTTYGAPPAATYPAPPAASYGAPEMVVGQYESTQQIPSINEATAVMGAVDEPTRANDAVPSTPMTSAPQWVSDPYGRHQMRYWDGERWTEHISNGGVAGTDRV
ncbi:MAG: DUF2510 domain-containing protein [Ilumatobacteraceae bacterium]